MKKQEKNQLKGKKIAELKKILEEKEKDLILKRVEGKAGREKNVHLLGKKRQEIAQVRTIIREKEFEEEAK